MTAIPPPANPLGKAAAFAAISLRLADLELRGAVHRPSLQLRFRLWAVRSAIRTTIRILDGLRSTGCNLSSSPTSQSSQWTPEELAVLSKRARQPIVTFGKIARGGGMA